MVVELKAPSPPRFYGLISIYPGLRKVFSFLVVMGHEAMASDR